MVDYRKIIIVLAVATAIEFGVSYVMAEHHGFLVWGILLLVAIAFFKAVLVAKFFMHLRYDPQILALICSTPLVLATPLNAVCIFDAVKGPAIGM
jgi:caa(3)-type oxidase subunit IV